MVSPMVLHGCSWASISYLVLGLVEVVDDGLEGLAIGLREAVPHRDLDLAVSGRLGVVAAATAGGQADGGHHAAEGRPRPRELGALLDLHGFLLFLLVSQDISSNRCSDIHQQPCLRCRSRFVSCTAVCNVVILIIQLFPSLYKSETRRWKSCFLYNLQLFVFVGIATFLTITQVSSLPAFPQERRHRPATRPWWSGSTDCRVPAHRSRGRTPST